MDKQHVLLRKLTDTELALEKACEYLALYTDMSAEELYELFINGGDF